MNLAHVVARAFPPVEQTYGWRDSALYALSLGMGSDPLDADELPYVVEHAAAGDLAVPVVPSQCVILGWQPFWHDEPAAAIDWARIVHGEMSLQLHRPLPPAGRARALHRIAAVQDKGPGRGALVHFHTELHDAHTGAHWASLQSVQFLRGDGGCGSHGAAPDPLPPIDAGARPVQVVDLPTTRQAALLYRLASGDLMPIHASPEVARRAGFERPISHGLNNLGLACRAILKHRAPGHPERLRTMAVRFVQPGYPGDTVRIELFDSDGDTLRFRARSVERDVLLLDRGRCTLAD